MAFELKQVVPWGRNIEEYISMFDLKEDDLHMKIAGFGDGPASFNAQMFQRGLKMVSFDPIYQFTKKELSERIDQTRAEVMEQTRKNKDNFVWISIPDMVHLENARITAMKTFLADFEEGKVSGRYIAHELPRKLPFTDNYFDIGLSSHFLMLYPNLGVDFHLSSISEMLRVCKELRIFPLLNLNAEPSEMLRDVVQYFENKYRVEIRKVDYEFQKNGNKMLVIK